jgi:DeoR family transcriptional regulator, aga operon transcriptional repressor
VFLNVVGLDVERGATTLEADEAVIFRAMQRQAREVIAVADHTKLAQVSPALICPVQEIHMLVTDTGATDAMIAPFEERGIKVLRV